MRKGQKGPYVWGQTFLFQGTSLWENDSCMVTVVFCKSACHLSFYRGPQSLYPSPFLLSLSLSLSTHDIWWFILRNCKIKYENSYRRHVGNVRRGKQINKANERINGKMTGNMIARKERNPSIISNRVYFIELNVVVFCSSPFYFLRVQTRRHSLTRKTNRNCRNRIWMWKITGNCQCLWCALLLRIHEQWKWKRSFITVTHYLFNIWVLSWYDMRILDYDFEWGPYSPYLITFSL